MKRIFKTVTAAALLSACTATFAFGLTACGGKSTASEAPSDVGITRLQAPTDGSLPTAHTAQENLAYMAYVLDNQSQYHCYTYTVTQASIATQYTKSYKDYRDGVTISSDITYSSMVKSGSQACFVNSADGQEAYMRYSAAPDAETTNLTAQWETGSPYYFDTQTYLTTYGLFQTEMTNYIINAETITDSSAATDNGDGTYSQSVVLDPVASTYYYQYGMKTRGGLTGFPEFQNVSLTFTFDSSWRVLAIDVDEVSKVNKGVTVTSTSHSRAEYSYDAADFDEAHYAYYDSYFKQYIGSGDLNTGGGSTALDVTGVLSNGFAGIMNGGQQFEVSLTLGEKVYKGYIFLGLDLADPLNSLNLKLSLGSTPEEQSLYVEYANGTANAYYGNDLAITANVAAVKLVVDEFVQWADGLNALFATGEGQDDSQSSGGISLSDDALSDLMDRFVLTQDEDSASLALQTDDLLGLGVGIDAVLNFSLGEDNAVAFTDATVGGISIGGEQLALELALQTTQAPVISRDPASTPADLSAYAADVFNLLSSDLVTLNLKLDGSSDEVKIDALKGIEADVTAYVDIDGITVGALADVSYTYQGHTFSAQIGAYYDGDPASASYGDIIVQITSVNGVATDIRTGCAVEELPQAVESLLKLANLNLNGLFSAESDISLNVADIINSVLTADFSAMLGDLSADSGKIAATVNIDEIISLFADTNISFGTLNLSYTPDYASANGGKLSAALPALGLSLEVQGNDGEIALPEGDYPDFADLVEAVNGAYSAINDIIEGQSVNLVIPAGNNYLRYADMSLAVTGTVSARWGEKGRVAADLNVKFAGAKHSATTNVKLIYNAAAGANSPLVRLSINGAALDIYAADLPAIQSQISTLSSVTPSGAHSLGDEQKLAAIVLELLAGGEWVNLLNNLTLTSDGQSLALQYIDAFTVGASVDVSDGLSLGVEAEYEKFSYTGKINVVRADIYSYVNRQIELSDPAGTADGASFTKVIYDYVFDAFNAIDLSDVLGGAYSVNLSLNGSNSAIDSLKGVQVNAALAFAERGEDNVADLSVWLNAGGTEVKFSVTLIGEQFYVSVANISGKDIPHLKLTTTADSLYSLITNLVDYAVEAGLLGGAYSAGADARFNAAITDIIYSLATIDFDEFITTSSAVEAKTMTVDIDGLLSALNINAGFAIGSVTAVLNEDLTFSVSAANAGREWVRLEAGKTDKDYSSFDTTGYIDFSQVTSLPVADILNLLNSDILKLNLSLENTFEGGHAVALSAQSYINVNGIAVAVDVTAAYSYNGIELDLALTAYYADDGLYLRITRINGEDCSLGVFCEADDVQSAIEALIAAAQTGFGDSVSGSDLSAVLDGLLTANFPAILSGVYSDGERIKADIDVDALASHLGLSTDLGTLSLEFADGALTAQAREIGLGIALSGAEEMPAFDTSDCLNLSDLVDFVKEAYAQIDGIVKSQSVAFEITQESPAYITVDGITAALYGNGEISWKNGGQTVALDLKVALSEGDGRDVLDIALVYNGNAADDEPFITFALNNVGVEMRRADVEDINNKLNILVNSISPLLGISRSGSAAILAEAPATAGSADSDDIVYAVLALLADTDWAGLLEKFTLTTDGSSVALSWADDNLVAIAADGSGIEFAYRGALSGEGSSFATGASVVLSKSTGSLADKISSRLSGDDYIIASSQNGQNFIKAVYDNLFEAIRSISVEEILGDNVYNVSFDINGANTNIAELQDIFVHAEMYVKRNTNGGTMTQLDLNFDIKGAVVNGAVIIDNDYAGKNTQFYINLTQVLNITLNGLKVQASQNTLYESVESLIDIMCNTDMLSGIVSLVPSSASTEVESLALSKESKESLTDIIFNLLNSDITSAFTGATANGVTTASVDLDAVMACLGLNFGSLGTIECKIDHSTHAITTSAVADGMGEKWLSLSSRRLKEAEVTSLNYALKTFDATQYIDIAFLPTLVDDLAASLTDDEGKMYESMTFEGDVSVNLLNLLNINISDLKLTINLSDGFYLALQGQLSGSLVTSRTIGITFHNDYITLYRGDGGGQYRVMTTAYFLDNMFGDGDTLNWLLGVNSLMWSIVKSAVPEVSSGLTTPGSLYLYSREESQEQEEVTVADYVNALCAIIGGEQVLEFTSQSGSIDEMLNTLDVSDNFYAFDLNARLLTDNVLTRLSAAILRGADGGITGIKAVGAIQSYVSFTLNLNYDESYNSSPLASHFAAAEEGFNSATNNGAVTDGDSGIFGCYNSEDGDVDFSYLLTPYTLSVIGLDGDVTQYIVREGSTVYLYDNAYPVYADDSNQFRLVYMLNGEILTSFVVSGDLAADGQITLYEQRRGAVDFTVTNNQPFASSFTYHSFVGDTLPSTFGDFAVVDEFVFESNGEPVAGMVVDAYTPTRIVGTYAPATQTINYVVYTFNTTDHTYHVTGRATGFVQYYIEGNRTLTLENEIDGITVTAIDDSAFANTGTDSDGNVDSTKSIQNVIVPANITYVGASAFKDNVGMQSIVFLAPSVTFGGSGTNSDSTYPFYGCSTYATSDSVNGANGNEQTVLTVYVNGVTNSNDEWKLFRAVNKFLWFRFYIGSDGGSVNTSGWAYADGFTVEGGELLEDITFNGSSLEVYVSENIISGLTDPVTLSANAAQLQTSVQAIIDEYSLGQYGYINAFTVSVQTINDGGACSYCVKIEEGEPRYAVTCLNGDVTLAVSGEGGYFNGTPYYGGDITITAAVIANSSTSKVAAIIVNGVRYEGNTASVTVTGPVQVDVEIAEDASATFVSDVAFTLNGEDCGDDNTVVVEDITAVSDFTPTPADSAYVFLGWASDVSGAMSFTTVSTAGVTYTAIWAVASEGVTYTVQTSGTTLNAPAVSSGAFYGWYADAQFASPLSGELSTENTIYVARRQFTFTYTVSGNLITKINDSKFGSVSGKSSLTNSITVLEKQTVLVEVTGDYTADVKVDGEVITTLTLEKYFFVRYTFKTDSGSLSGGMWTSVAMSDISAILNY